MGFRDFYDKTLEDLEKEELKWHTPITSLKNAKERLRMYANLYNRDIRKQSINSGSKCNICGSTEDLEVDHIIPISKGGRNTKSNVQVLCSTCNLNKRDKINTKQYG